MNLDTSLVCDRFVSSDLNPNKLIRVVFSGCITINHLNPNKLIRVTVFLDV